MCIEKLCATYPSLILMVNYSHCNPQPILVSDTVLEEGRMLIRLKELRKCLMLRMVTKLTKLRKLRTSQESQGSSCNYKHVNYRERGESSVELSACCIWHLEDKAFARCHLHCDGLLIVQLSLSHLCSCKKPITHDPLSELDKLIGSPS